MQRPANCFSGSNFAVKTSKKTVLDFQEFLQELTRRLLQNNSTPFLFNQLLLQNV